jgi:hypothetical protein
MCQAAEPATYGLGCRDPGLTTATRLLLVCTSWRASAAHAPPQQLPSMPSLNYMVSTSACWCCSSHKQQYKAPAGGNRLHCRCMCFAAGAVVDQDTVPCKPPCSLTTVSTGIPGEPLVHSGRAVLPPITPPDCCCLKASQRTNSTASSVHQTTACVVFKHYTEVFYGNCNSVSVCFLPLRHDLTSADHELFCTV